MVTHAQAVEPEVGGAFAEPSSWRRWRPTIALVAWSLFVWVGRVRNVLADDGLDAEGRNLRLALALSFVVPAAVLAIAIAVDFRRRLTSSAPAWLAAAFAVWTVLVWFIRGSDIAFDGSYDIGFRLVHSVLAVVSFIVAGWVLSTFGLLRRRVTIS